MSIAVTWWIAQKIKKIPFSILYSLSDLVKKSHSYDWQMSKVLTYILRFHFCLVYVNKNVNQYSCLKHTCLSVTWATLLNWVVTKHLFLIWIFKSWLNHNHKLTVIIGIQQTLTKVFCKNQIGYIKFMIKIGIYFMITHKLCGVHFISVKFIINSQMYEGMWICFSIYTHMHTQKLVVNIYQHTTRYWHNKDILYCVS